MDNTWTERFGNLRVSSLSYVFSGASLSKPVQVPAPEDDTMKVDKAPAVEEV